MEQRICPQCDGPLRNVQDNKRFCSRRCAALHKGIKGKPRQKAHNSRTGAFSELVVSIDLLRRGYHVFRALNPDACCDLVAVKDEQVLRIEVRTAVLNKNGVVQTNRKGSYDVFAAVVDRDVFYEPSGTIR